MIRLTTLLIFTMISMSTASVFGKGGGDIWPWKHPQHGTKRPALVAPLFAPDKGHFESASLRKSTKPVSMADINSKLHARHLRRKAEQKAFKAAQTKKCLDTMGAEGRKANTKRRVNLRKILEPIHQPGRPEWAGAQKERGKKHVQSVTPAATVPLNYNDVAKSLSRAGIPVMVEKSSKKRRGKRTTILVAEFKGEAHPLDQLLHQETVAVTHTSDGRPLLIRTPKPWAFGEKKPKALSIKQARKDKEARLGILDVEEEDESEEEISQENSIQEAPLEEEQFQEEQNEGPAPKELRRQHFAYHSKQIRTLRSQLKEAFFLKDEERISREIRLNRLMAYHYGTQGQKPKYGAWKLPPEDALPLYEQALDRLTQEKEGYEDPELVGVITYEIKRVQALIHRATIKIDQYRRLIDQYESPLEDEASFDDNYDFRAEAYTDRRDNHLARQMRRDKYQRKNKDNTYSNSLSRGGITVNIESGRFVVGEKQTRLSRLLREGQVTIVKTKRGHVLTQKPEASEAEKPDDAGSDTEEHTLTESIPEILNAEKHTSEASDLWE